MASIPDETVDGTPSSQTSNLRISDEGNSHNNDHANDVQCDTKEQAEEPNGNGRHVYKNVANNQPKRSFMDDPDIRWRLGHPPDYSLVNRQFMEERSKHHKPGSLEETVENLVKTWEMEASHKLDPRQWETVDYDSYQFVVNGVHSFNIQEALERGTYNMLIVDSPYYDNSNHTFESSHHLFKEAFQGSFPWEVLEVHSGPPKVTFTWRHWGRWSGNYDQTPPTHQTVETFGVCIAHVNEDLKIGKLEIYYDANSFLRQFVRHSSAKCPIDRSK